jgi:hypothetical protein
MKYIILIIYLIALSGCKSAKTHIKNNVDSRIENIDIADVILGSVNISTNVSTLTDNIEIIRYEPVQYTYRGVDTVVFKPVKIRRITTDFNELSFSLIDTTRRFVNNTEIVQNVDKTNSNKEYKGFDFVKSIISAIVGSVFGSIMKYFWIIGLFIGLVIYNFIRYRLKKNK